MTPLRVVSGARSLRLDEAMDVATIGRAAENDLVVDGSRVSRRHGKIERKDHHWVYSDTGSSCGSYVNGQRIDNVVLAPHVVIALGDADGPRLTVASEVVDPSDAPTGVFDAPTEALPPRSTASPGAGWYADPSNPGVRRFWDGVQWTEATSRQEDTPPQPPTRFMPPPAQHQSRSAPPSPAPFPAPPASPAAASQGLGKIIALLIAIAAVGAVAWFILQGPGNQLLKSPSWRAGYTDVVGDSNVNWPVALPTIDADPARVAAQAKDLCQAYWPIAQMTQDLPRNAEGDYVAGCQAGWGELARRARG